MSALFALMTVMGLAGVVGLMVIEVREYQRRVGRWQVLRLQFGRDVSADAVLGVLSRMAGLRRGTLVQLDVRADSAGIRHYLGTDQATMETMRGVFRALLPSLRLEVPEAGEADVAYRAGRVLRIGGRLRVLRRGEHQTTAAGLLAAMQPLGRGERLLLRWTLKPGRARHLVRRADDQMATEDRRLLREKQAGPLLQARGVLAAGSGHAKRADHLLGRVVAVLRSRSTAVGAIRALLRSRAGMERELGWLPVLGFDRYAVDELAGLLGWPIDAPALPGVSIGTSPLLMPSARVPQTGRVLGTATWPGNDHPVAQPVLGALSHSLIAGPTGVGKSTLVASLAVQDMAAGRGLVVIDGKGDTVSALLERIPGGREDDVVLLDCAADGPLPGISLFGAGDPELAADVVLGVLADLFRDSWGPLSERYLRAGLVAVAHAGDALADLPFVYADAGYRRRLVGQIRDPLTRSTLAAFEGMSAGERAQQLAAPLNKLGSLLGRPVVRTVLGQAEPKLDFREVLNDRKIVLVSLSPTRVGAAAARLLGAVLVFALFQAVQGRSRLSEAARRPFMVLIDEPRVLGDLPMPLDVLLEQSRGLGVGVGMAPQSLAQLPASLSRAVLTNAATRVVFRQNADDARLLAKDLPGVRAEDLQDLGRYEAVARIGLGPGDVAPPLTLRTHELVKPTSEPERIRDQAANQYGQTLETVDAGLDARHRIAAEPGPAVGRKRMTS